MLGLQCDYYFLLTNLVKPGLLYKHIYLVPDTGVFCWGSHLVATVKVARKTTYMYYFISKSEKKE